MNTRATQFKIMALLFSLALSLAILLLQLVTQGFQVAEGSPLFNVSLSVGFYGSLVSMLFMFLSLALFVWCTVNQYSRGIKLALLVIVTSFLSTWYANFGYLETRKNECRWLHYNNIAATQCDGGVLRTQ